MDVGRPRQNHACIGLNDALLLAINITALIQDNFSVGVRDDQLSDEDRANGLCHGNGVADQSIGASSRDCGVPVGGAEESLFANPDEHMAYVDIKKG